MKPASDASLPKADPEASRLALLEMACASDRTLWARIESLVHTERVPVQPGGDPGSTRIADPPVAPAGAFSSAEDVGAWIGRYHLLQSIGEGGCGTVYMAEQEEPVRRRVALKLIKPGMDSKSVIARFEAERQALAMMDHPHIAKVLDAGTTDSGRPYFVMELVRGVPLNRYCEEAKLAVPERVKLFVQVCQAVQHAHQKGIIHRDLKPSNILVTLHDGVPVPKVIDFGIAKAVEQKLTDKTLFTEFQAFIGTPAYMSPEQAELSGLDIDTRTDIYSLGVVLYELLTGATPFDAKELAEQGLDGMRRTIREVEPVRPSTRLTQLQERKIDSRLAIPPSELPSDLDWIVMKCLEKERGRRYETANGLAADLRRHLANEPVTARPPSAAYRVGKFVRRNRLLVGAVAAVGLSLLLGLGSAARQYARERGLRQRMEAVFFEHGLFAAMSGDTTLMASALAEAREAGIGGGYLRMLEGQHALASGRPEDAVRLLQGAVRELPETVAAHALLASAQVQAQHWTDWESTAHRMSQLKLRTPEDYLFMGQSLSFDDWTRALELLDEAVARRPGALGHIVRSDARITKAYQSGLPEDIDAALADIDAARTKSWSTNNLALLINTCWAHVNAGVIYRRIGNSVRADRHFAEADAAGRALERYGTNPLAVLERLIQLEMSGREDGPDGALALMERLVEREGVRDRLILLRLGNAYFRRGDPARALATYEKADGRDDFIDGVRLMALLEIPARRAEFDGALRRFEGDYRGGVVESHVPWYLNYAGRPEEARRRAREFVDHPPDSFSRLRTHYPEMAGFLAGRISEDALLASARKIGLGDRCEAESLVGVRCLGQGDRAGAKRHLRAAVDTACYMYAHYSFAQIALARLESDPKWPSWIPEKTP